MKTRAAVAWEAGKPLSIEEVDLQGPRAAEVQCNCIAGTKGQICKHGVCVVFCRKHGLRPFRPIDTYAAPAPQLPSSALAPPYPAVHQTP